MQKAVFGMGTSQVRSDTAGCHSYLPAKDVLQLSA